MFPLRDHHVIIISPTMNVPHYVKHPRHEELGERKKYRRHLTISFISFFAVLVFAAMGYWILGYICEIDDFHFTHCLEVAFKRLLFGEEEVPMPPILEWFDIVVRVTAIGTMLYLFSSILGVILEGELSDYMRRRAMNTRIASLRNHFILAGAGRVGGQILNLFAAHGVDLVLIEKDRAVAFEMMKHKKEIIIGDALDEDVLRLAGIERAKGLIAALNSETDNTSLILTARSMNPNLSIIARAHHPDQIIRMRTAGAHYVVFPEHVAGTQMAWKALEQLGISLNLSLIEEGYPFWELCQLRDSIKGREVSKSYA